MGTLRNCFLLLLGISSCWQVNCDDPEIYQPQQVHIAIGDTNEEMTISWVTNGLTPSSVVEFGKSSLDQVVTSLPTNFTNLGLKPRVMYLHKVTLSNLDPDTLYLYHCGSEYGWSDLFAFKTWKTGSDWPVSVAMYGDLGAANAQSLPRLQEDVVKGYYHAIIHNGDFAYNMQDNTGEVGDQFMRLIQPIAALVPYMTVPGNHEYDMNNNFRNYKHRFNMPNHEQTNSYYYSWNMGPVHFIGVNTELFYDPLHYVECNRQYDWLVEDLKEATKLENRAERPWIIIFGHRPMYCSTACHDDCYNIDCKVRVGLQHFNINGIEDLLYDYGVDLAVWAHEHSYERMFPIYNYTVVNGTAENPYDNPPVPVHFTTGSAGCSEIHDGFEAKQPEWSGYRSTDYGYTRLTVHNKTHLYWEQVSDDQAGAIIDSVWYIRDKHVSFAEAKRNLNH